jgi:membrane-bound ClpP family serine protease
MAYGRGKKPFTIYSIVSTALEEAALAVILLWIFPQFGINTPIWLVITLGIAWIAWSYLMYRVGEKTIGKTPAVGIETLIGVRCKTVTPLSPDGYVRIDDELWQAQSIPGEINTGVEVMIVEVKGLTLLVIPSSTGHTV